MAAHFPSSILLVLLLSVATQATGGPPSPGIFPSSKIKTMGFNKNFRNLWGPQHQKLKNYDLTIWLDRSCGSGFKSIQSYRSGYFGASIKLQSGYTAGVITSLYLSNAEAYPGYHDEVDIEFLGTTFGQPYVLQTNVYIKGSGDGIIGREVKFHLWFDPTKAFHHYAIYWSPIEIIFLVDDVPIRRYTKKTPDTFPVRPMWVYGSIWDASAWATEQGKYKADYRYQPFVGQYTNFKVSGCTADSPSSCHPGSVSPYRSGGLSKQQFSAMTWADRSYKIYDYCKDPARDHSQTPECKL